MSDDEVLNLILRSKTLSVLTGILGGAAFTLLFVLLGYFRLDFGHLASGIVLLIIGAIVFFVSIVVVVNVFRKGPPATREKKSDSYNY